jgi:hypothetical protein
MRERCAATLVAVLKLVLTLLVAPALVGVATIAARRWGQRLGGLVSAHASRS